MKIHSLTTILNAIALSVPSSNAYCCLQCGSSILEHNPRDFDIMVYYLGNCKVFVHKLQSVLQKYFSYFSLNYLNNYHLYSLKIKCEDIEASLHIVSWKMIKRSLSSIEKSRSYTSINIFSEDLKKPVLWRTWVQETLFLAGNQEMHQELMAQITKANIPYSNIKEELRKAVDNQIHYYEHKKNNGEFCQLAILIQMLNSLILYCYAENCKFLGTFKYLENDLNSFDQQIDIVAICRKTIDILYGHRKIPFSQIFSDVSSIMELR